MATATPHHQHEKRNPGTRARRIATCGETARYLRRSERTLEGWRVRGGGPPFVRLGKRSVVYDLDAVDAWLDAHQRTSTSDPGPQAVA